MRVAQVLLSPRIGGAETLAKTLAHEWARDGIESTTLFVDTGTSNRSRAQRVRDLRRSIRDLAPDVVLAHSAVPNLYSRIATPTGTPVVTVLHSATRDFDKRVLRWSERALRRRTAAVVAVSSGQREEYASRFGEQGLRLIPNGVSDLFSPRAAYRDTPTQILTMGRVVEQKNPALWATVGETLARSESDLAFLWVGPTGLDAGYRELEARFSAADAPVRFHGATETPHELMSMADVFFHTADREAHSIVLLEVAVTGLPIVCSEQVATSLPDDMPRYTFATGDARSAGEAVSAIIRDYPNAVRRARHWARTQGHNWGASRTARQYVEVFESLIPRREKAEQ